MSEPAQNVGSHSELRDRVQLLLDRQAALENRLVALAAETAVLQNAARALGYLSEMPRVIAPRHQQGSILLYHRVAQLSPDVANLCVASDVFRGQMEYLARTCQPMTLTDLVKAAASGEIPERAVAITLDDGYRDALTAGDILARLHIPATFFVNSSACGETLLDSLSRIFLEGHPVPSEFSLLVADTTIRLRCSDERERRAVFDIVREVVWSLDSEGRRGILEAVRRWSGIDPFARETHRVLSPAELRELASLPGLEIGSHTRNHLFLPAQTRAVKINEISTNLEYLSTLLGKAVRSFAYPYGAFDQETVQICRAIGFRDCVTVVPQTIRPWSDPCLLPRHEVKARGLDEFKSFIDDIFH